MDTEKLIKDFIQLELINDGDSIKLGNTDSLIETGIIDSLGIMKLLAFLEETFEVHISDYELLPENFECIEAISLLVQNKSS